MRSSLILKFLSAHILKLFSAPSRATSAYEASMEQSVEQLRQHEKNILKILLTLVNEANADEMNSEVHEAEKRLIGLLTTLQQGFMSSFRTIHQGLEGNDANVSERQIKKAKKQMFSCKQTIQHEIEQLPLSPNMKEKIFSQLDSVHTTTNKLSDTLEQSLRIRHARNFKF